MVERAIIVSSGKCDLFEFHLSLIETGETFLLDNETFLFGGETFLSVAAPRILSLPKRTKMFQFTGVRGWKCLLGKRWFGACCKYRSGADSRLVTCGLPTLR